MWQSADGIEGRSSVPDDDRHEQHVQESFVVLRPSPAPADSWFDCLKGSLAGMKRKTTYRENLLTKRSIGRCNLVNGNTFVIAFGCDHRRSSISCRSSTRVGWRSSLFVRLHCVLIKNKKDLNRESQRRTIWVIVSHEKRRRKHRSFARSLEKNRSRVRVLSVSSGKLIREEHQLWLQHKSETIEWLA